MAFLGVLNFQELATLPFFLYMSVRKTFPTLSVNLHCLNYVLAIYGGFRMRLTIKQAVAYCVSDVEKLQYAMDTYWNV